jgi:hypothetical protein
MRVHPLRNCLLLLAVPGMIAVFAGCSDNPAQSTAFPLPAIDPLDTGNQADYLMITPESLIEGLPRLVAYRESQGHSVAVVTLERIADAFPDAPSTEEGIRTFIAYAHGNWQEPRVEYVLLVGGTDLIPTYFFESSLDAYGEGEVAIDDPYATLEGDDDAFPDLAMGRFPVSNLRELAVVSNKTMEFEQPDDGAYQADGLFVADYVLNFGTTFERQADLLAGLFPKGTTIDRIDLREDSPNFGTKEELIEALTYLGSANDTLWSENNLLTVTDVPGLPTEGNPSLVVTSTSNQKFQDFREETLIRDLLLLESGGSVASVAPSGLSRVYGGYAFLSSFWENLWNSPDATLGKAVLATKRTHEAGLDGDFQSLPSRFTLLGDPALRVTLPPPGP